MVVSLLAYEYDPDSIPLLLSLHFFSYINLVRFYLHQLLSDHKLFVFYTLVQKQYLHLHLLCDKLFTSFIDIEPPMLKCCGCQTNFILPLGGSFLFSKNFLPTPSLTGGLVMPIRRTIKPSIFT